MFTDPPDFPWYPSSLFAHAKREGETKGGAGAELPRPDGGGRETATARRKAGRAARELRVPYRFQSVNSSPVYSRPSITFFLIHS